MVCEYDFRVVLYRKKLSVNLRCAFPELVRSVLTLRILTEPADLNHNKTGRLTVNRKKLIALGVVLCTAISFAATGAEPQPTLKQALEAPAGNLAQGYLYVKFLTQYVLPLAEMGVNIQLGGEAINKSNAKKYQQRYNERLSIYSNAIKQRGYSTMAGTYKGKATAACSHIRSMLVDMISVGKDFNIEIKQDGFDAEVIVSGKIDGEEFSLKNLAAIADSCIAIQDGMNSEYYFLGKIKNNKIEIKPSASVLGLWPEWSGPPAQNDIENCIISLEAISDDSNKPLDKR